MVQILKLEERTMCQEVGRQSSLPGLAGGDTGPAQQSLAP